MANVINNEPMKRMMMMNCSTSSCIGRSRSESRPDTDKSLNLDFCEMMRFEGEGPDHVGRRILRSAFFAGFA